MELFTKLNQDGTTIVVVTHETEVATYTNRIINLRDGLLIGENTNSNIDKAEGEE